MLQCHSPLTLQLTLLTLVMDFCFLRILWPHMNILVYPRKLELREILKYIMCELDLQGANRSSPRWVCYWISPPNTMTMVIFHWLLTQLVGILYVSKKFSRFQANAWNLMEIHLGIHAVLSAVICWLPLWESPILVTGNLFYDKYFWLGGESSLKILFYNDGNAFCMSGGKILVAKI